MSSRMVGVAALLLAISVSPPALAATAHAHDSARLHVTVDGALIALRMDSPLQPLLGFERAPRSDTERGEVLEMAQALRSGKQFVPTAAARCRLEWVKLASPVLAPELLGGGAPGATGDEAGEHAALEGKFIYRCENAKALRGIEVMLFDTFKRLRRVDAKVTRRKGESALKLTATARQIRW